MNSLFASTARGLEELLKTELENLGAVECQVVQGGVHFKGDTRLVYQSLMWSRLASRIMLPLGECKVYSDLDLYLGVQAINWTEMFNPGATFAVHFSGLNDTIRNSQYGAMKVKDAIVDAFTRKNLPRPNVDRDAPDIRVNVWLHKETASIALDLSGDGLHLRGYRDRAGIAPIKETLAAAIVMRSGWQPGTPLLDPMCGSGTLLIEAAMLATDRAPGLHRGRWGFSGWAQHDEAIWQEGDTLTPKGSSITEGKTKPKPLHTEATLLSAMETAGKEIEDDALRQAMKDCGIGTPATRASIIETLFKRGYMERCKKSLVPTEKGLALNSVVKTMRIADVAMTGEWEKELARIERGELSDDTFRKEIEAYTREITSELISCDKLFGSRDSGCACPKCGTGRMRFYGKVVRCDNTECGLPVFRLKAGRTLSDDEIKDLLTEGHTKLLKGFKSKQGKSFDAVVAFDGEYNTTFVFPEAKKDKKFSGRKK